MRYYVRAFFGNSIPILYEHFTCRRNAQELFNNTKMTALSLILCVMDEDFFYDPDNVKATIIESYGHTVLEVGMKTYPKTF